MGPWSADLPDVSPPEKQLACQRARLYLNTHSSTPRSCMRPRKTQALMVSELGWDRRGGGKEKEKEGSVFLDVMSTAELMFVGFRADWLAAWLLGCLACWLVERWASVSAPWTDTWEAAWAPPLAFLKPVLHLTLIIYSTWNTFAWDYF